MLAKINFQITSVPADGISLPVGNFGTFPFRGAR